MVSTFFTRTYFSTHAWAIAGRRRTRGCRMLQRFNVNEATRTNGMTRGHHALQACVQSDNPADSKVTSAGSPTYCSARLVMAACELVR